MSSSHARLAKTALAIAAAACAAQSATAAIYNPTASFSITNGNPNGVWTYGYSESLDLAAFSTTFTPMTFTYGPDGFGFGWAGHEIVGPSIGLNTSTITQYGVLPGMLTQHPGPIHQPSLLRFTAPESVTADIVGEYFAGDIGAMQVAVLINGTAVWTATDAGVFNESTTLQAGDTIDFAVYGNYGFGNTPLALTITTVPTAVPEPSASVALAGLGALGLAATQRRRRA